MYGAGGLFFESGAGLGAAESAATGAGAAVGTSLFSSVLGIAGLGMMAFNLFNTISSQREQRKQQEKLAKAQIEQSNLLREKIKADNAGLYSSAQSVIAQRSGAMGAVY